MHSDVNSLNKKASAFFSLLQTILFLLFILINWGSSTIAFLLFSFFLYLGINGWFLKKQTDYSLKNTLLLAITNLVFAFIFIELSGDVNSPFYPMYYLPWISLVGTLAKKKDRLQVLGIATLASILSFLNIKFSNHSITSTDWVRLGVYCISYFSLGVSVWLFRQMLILTAQEADQDSLTGLFNRNGGKKILEQAIQDYQKEKTTFSFVLCDIDHFKTINDTYGHLYGDEILKELGYILNKMSPEHTKVIRWGGEEFLILFRGLDKDESYRVVNSIRQQVAEYSFTYFQKESRITISAGIIEMKEQHKTLEHIIDEVDRFLYSAKREGRNQIITC